MRSFQSVIGIDWFSVVFAIDKNKYISACMHLAPIPATHTHTQVEIHVPEHTWIACMHYAYNAAVDDLKTMQIQHYRQQQQPLVCHARLIYVCVIVFIDDILLNSMPMAHRTVNYALLVGALFM